VKVGLPENQKTIFELSQLPLKEAQAFFSGLALTARRRRSPTRSSRKSSTGCSS
jgi:hypothetical protein